jgi:multiple sugar transport system ATP-binding protein
MSVYDNMAFGLKLRKTPKSEIERRVREAGGLLGIEDLLDRKPKQLSGGQRQRVALGRAIVREPAVFLMDEPLSNLDAKLRVQTRAEISKLHQRLETTFIYVTHDQVEAMTMGSRICVLRDGLMMQIDAPQDLYDLPNNVFVAGFIGSPAMNFFDATLVEQDGDLYVDTGMFRLKLSPDKAQAARSYAGKQVVFGARPEDIHDREYVPPGIRSEPLTATVDVTELMGNEIFVYLLIGQKQFIARVDPRTGARVGIEMDVVVNMDNTHLFDRETDQAIR